MSREIRRIAQEISHIVFPPVVQDDGKVLVAAHTIDLADKLAELASEIVRSAIEP